jgi:hypothetical protein
MAALTAAQVSRVWSDDAADRTAVYKVSNVSSGDTVDLGPTGAVPDYQLVKRCAMVATTVSGTAACSVSGTTVTFPAGLSADAGYIMVWGDTN